MKGSQKTRGEKGSSSGIGAGAAVLFAKRGCSLALTGRDEARLQDTEKKCLDAGLKEDMVLTVVGDITDQKTREELINRTVEKFGKINILVNNAGIFAPCLIKDIEEKDIDFLFDLNVKSVVMLTRLAVPHLLKAKGNIVNISSVASTIHLHAATLYCMTKAAIDAFTQAAASEFGAQGIRVNSVNPGAVKTPTFSRAVGGDPDLLEKLYDAQAKFHALQRMGETDEVAETVAFLASDAASFVSGTTLYVDGARRAMAGMTAS
ncbi:3-oxoacyl-[acyl-carrier-protein] reductase FabG [Aplysia californica]|uniref:3-oxoacyl-[acyl-carrier-protein] reductase FabG n=1 Tax=Aplysia californica TaxID=6500 RepID=A0ABM1A1M5_APLCA|nr:3-oxoacyl-[acyl-carrier-protein] reductase FabG [Aplysia californica]